MASMNESADVSRQAREARPVSLGASGPEKFDRTEDFLALWSPRYHTHVVRECGLSEAEPKARQTVSTMASSQRKAHARNPSRPARGLPGPQPAAAEAATPTRRGFLSATWMRALVIVLAGVAAYANSIGNPLVLDDRVSIVENEDIQDWTDLSRVLAPRRESPVAGRPLVNVTLALNYAVAGVTPALYRATNLAIHILCALLLMGAVRRTFTASSRFAMGEVRASDLGWAVAVIWAVHPLTSEVVDYITQRTESMMALFLFGTLYASARAHASPVPRRWEALAVLSCLLGMACKESMVVAPVLVFVCDAWLVYPSIATAVKRRATFYGLLSATWVALVALNWWGPRMRSAGFRTAVDPWTYLLNQAPIIVEYLRLSLWPRGLVVMYGAPRALTLADVWPSGLVIVALLIATAVALWRRSWIGAAGAWVFVALAPASSIVPIATEVGAERRMYVPLVAIVCVAVWSAMHGLERLGRGRGPLVALLTGVTALLAAGTIARNAEYATPLVLAQTVLDRRPSGYASHMMAEALMSEDRVDEAIPLLREAIGESPRAQFALGVVFFNTGRYAEAYAELDAFVRREPLLLEVVTARVIMGKVRAMEGRWAEAVEQFREVLRMNPAEPEAPGLLAEALFSNDEFEAAIPAYNAYLGRAPDDLDARCNLGIALLAVERPAEAIAMFQRNVEIDPTHAPTRVNLALALFDAREAEAALPHAQQAVRLEPGNPARHDFLGRVLAVLGRVGEARQTFERALEIDPTYAPARENIVRLEGFVRSFGSAR